MESQGNPASPFMPRKAPNTSALGHRSLEELLNSPVWKLLPEISPLKPTAPRPVPVTSPLKTPGHSRQRAVLRSLKRTFEELFGDCSDLDDWVRKKEKEEKKNGQEKEEEEPSPSLIGWIRAITRRYIGCLVTVTVTVTGFTDQRSCTIQSPPTTPPPKL